MIAVREAGTGDGEAASVKFREQGRIEECR